MTRSRARDPDPARALLSRGMTVFLVGGFVLFLLPPALVTAVTGDSLRERLGALVYLGYFGWLVWGHVRLLRLRGEEPSGDYWRRSAAGHGVGLTAMLCLIGWDLAVGDFDARSLVLPGLAAGLVLGALAAARRSDEPAH